MAMKYISPALDIIPSEATLLQLREIAQSCTACPLYRDATQTVFGEGPLSATIVFIGEQPGDQEDKEGKPFIGPAGRLFDKCLEAAGIPREKAYVSNVVKHFKFEPRGKQRIHKKPSSKEIAACRPWLDAELHNLKPQLVVCLGATAAQALLGKDFRITRDRGKSIQREGLPPLLTTVHPSSILRSRTSEERQLATEAFIEDLKKAAKLGL